MTDCFALLDETRRPWLDPEALREKFLAHSARLHPDRVHGATIEEKQVSQQLCAELNSAYLRLRNPRDRLQHLIELELGQRPEPIQEVPPDLLDLCFNLARLFGEAKDSCRERAGITSPLLKVDLMVNRANLTDRLAAVLQELRSREGELLVRLREVDRQWEQDEARSQPRGKLLGELEEISRSLGFYSRWREQVQENLVQLQP